jgi:hypothetical protein
LFLQEQLKGIIIIMAMPKISFLDAKEIVEERELERIFTAKGQQ